MNLYKSTLFFFSSCGRLRRESPAKSGPSRVVATHVSSVRSWSSHTSAKSAPSRVVATHVSSVRSWSSDTSQEERQKTIAAHDTNFENDPQLASGKTTVKILNQETEDGMFIDAYSCMGFRLNNGMRVMGPCAVFPRSVLHWNVSTPFTPKNNYVRCCFLSSKNWFKKSPEYRFTALVFPLFLSVPFSLVTNNYTTTLVYCYYFIMLNCHTIVH